MYRAVPAAGHFVQRAERQTAARKHAVDFVETERQPLASTSRRSQAFDPLSQSAMTGGLGTTGFQPPSIEF
jgi:hypothetical protein